MANLIQQFIDGKQQQASGATLSNVVDPALAQTIRQVAFATATEVDQAVSSAKEAYASWSTVVPLKRARILFKFKSLLEQYTDQLAALLTEEHGKVQEDAQGEVMRAIELVEYLCGIPHLLKGNYSQNVADGVDCYTIRQSLGVCVGITPFNFPVMIGCWMFVSAIACGNTFVLKPSEKNPSATMLLAELMQQSGLPDGVLNVVHGDKQVVNQLITHVDVQAVCCVGSTPVAGAIYKTAIDAGKRAHTFGGAKNHCVIMPDADLDEAASALLGSAYGAAGERCMALSVAVTVSDEVADGLVERLKALIPSLKIGRGNQPGMDMGPLISAAHREKVIGYIDKGIDQGAQLIVDGRDYVNPDNPSGYFLGASLFDRVSPTMDIYQAEIFGPVLVVIRVKTLEEAISLINNNAYGNGTSILTQHGGWAHQFAEQVQVGMIGINVPIPVPVAYHTFGGWKQSIFGDLQMHGPESILFYTRSKSVTLRWPKDKVTTAEFSIPSH